jgi:hypothetical protein
MLSIEPHRPHRHPHAGPPVLAALKITPPCGHRGCFTVTSTACGRLPRTLRPRRPQAVLAPACRHPSCHLPALRRLDKVRRGRGRRPSPNALTVAPWTPPSPRASRPQPSSLPHPPPMLAPLHPQGVCAQKPRNLRCVMVRDFVATRYLRQSAGSSPPTPSSSTSTLSTSSGRFGSCWREGRHSTSRAQRS